MLVIGYVNQHRVIADSLTVIDRERVIEREEIIYLDSEDSLSVLQNGGYRVIGYTGIELGNYYQQQSILYLVQPGDSLYLIARRFNTTVGEIKKANDLEDDLIYAGQRLYIPDNGSDSPGNDPDNSNDERGDQSDKGNMKSYTVQPGDSLYLIARRFNTTVAELKNANGLQGDMIYAGQRIFIKYPGIDEKHFNLILDYRVEYGDDIDTIAAKFDISTRDIRLFNRLENDVLYSGQTLKIPLDVSEQEQRSRVFVSEEEMELLARAVYSEARGEPFTGQVAVAGVIFNRVSSELFPNTISNVIFQPWQFTAVHDGQFWLEPDQRAYAAVRAALQGWDPSRGAIFYYNPKTAESDWIFYREVIVEIGDHYFALTV